MVINRYIIYIYIHLKLLHTIILGRWYYKNPFGEDEAAQHLAKQNEKTHVPKHIFLQFHHDQFGPLLLPSSSPQCCMLDKI